MIVAPLTRVHTLITDSDANAQDLEPLRTAGVNITIAVAGRERDASIKARRT